MNKLVLYIMEVCSKAMARETILNDRVASGNRWVTRHSEEVPIHEEAIIHLSDAVNRHERTIADLKKEISDNELLISQLCNTIEELETSWYTKFLTKIKSIKLPYLKVNWR